MSLLEQTLKKFSGAIITGGSSGIGATFIEHISKLNPDLRWCNLSRSQPKEFGDHDSRLHLGCDLTQAGERERVASRVGDWIEKLEPGSLLLINNSGFGAYGPFPEPDRDRHLAMIELNMGAPVDLTARLLPELRKRGGSVINIASTAAFQPTPYLATYGATKAFLLHWSLALSRDLKEDGIQVLCVCPGPTSTAFFRAAGFKDAPMEGKGQSPDAVVRASLRALARGRMLVTSGWQNKCVSAFASKLPKVWVTVLAHWILRKLRLERFQ